MPASACLSATKLSRALAQVLLDARHLRAAERRLQLAHAVVEPEQRRVVHAGDRALGVRAVDAEGARARDRLGDAAVARHEHAALGGGDVLDGVEAEGRVVAEEADVRALPAGAERDGAVFDDLEPVLLGERQDGRHLARNAGEVHERDGARARRDGGGDAIGGDVARRRIGVDEDGTRADPLDAVHGGDVRQRRRDHLVARLEPEVQIRKVQRRHARADRHAVRAAAGERGELGLERLALARA